MAQEQQVDVLIVGAGPAGLLLTWYLARNGISTYTIDSADKEAPDFPMYGRAACLHRKDPWSQQSFHIWTDNKVYHSSES